MASHVRYLLGYAGGMYCGPRIKGILQDLSRGELHVKTKADVITAFNLLKKQHKLSLWIFQEKRGVAQTRSRYKKLCAMYGIGRFKPAPVAVPEWIAADVAVPAPIHYQVHFQNGRVRNGRANQQPGLAPAPRRANRGAQAANGGAIQFAMPVYDNPLG